MATSTVTAEVNSSAIPPSVTSSPASSAPTEAPASSSGLESATSSAPQSGESAQNGELSPQDFSSLEDYAKALIEKKQSAVAEEKDAQPEPATVSPEQDRNDAEVNDLHPEEEQARVAQPPLAVDVDFEGEDFLSTKALN